MDRWSDRSGHRYGVPDSLAAAVSVEQARKLGKTAAATDQGKRIELARGERLEGRAGVVGRVVKRPRERDFGIVETARIEADARPRSASSEKEDLSARGNEVGQTLPDLRAAGAVDGEIRGKAIRRAAGDIERLRAERARERQPVGAPSGHCRPSAAPPDDERPEKRERSGTVDQESVSAM